MDLCKNCKHYSAPIDADFYFIPALCGHPDLREPVEGSKQACDELRKPKGGAGEATCGPTGVHWEPR